MRIAINNNGTLYIYSETTERVPQFAHLGSIIDNAGGAQADIATRIRKAQIAFNALKQHLATNGIFKANKIRIFSTKVKPVLLYGCETCRNSKCITTKLLVFITKCGRKILRIFRPDQITNDELWKRTKQPCRLAKAVWMAGHNVFTYVCISV